MQKQFDKSNKKKLSKRKLLKLYRAYIFGNTVPGVADWEKYIPTFAFQIPEAERQIIHEEYSNRGNS